MYKNNFAIECVKNSGKSNSTVIPNTYFNVGFKNYICEYEIWEGIENQRWNHRLNIASVLSFLK